MAGPLRYEPADAVIKMDEDDAEALDYLLEFMYIMKPLTTIAERRPESDDFVAWAQVLMKTYQLADKYQRLLLLEIVFGEVMHLFAHGMEPALIKSISLLQSMGEQENIFNLGRLPDISYGLIETLSVRTQEFEYNLDVYNTLHRLQAEDSMQRIDRYTCQRVDDGMPG